MVEGIKENRKMRKTKKRKSRIKIIKKKKRVSGRIKKFDDFRNQNLSVIFEDITSHRREVREIEELTFNQLKNLRNKLNTIIRKKVPVSSFNEEDNQDDEKRKEEE